MSLVEASSIERVFFFDNFNQSVVQTSIWRFISMTWTKWVLLKVLYQLDWNITQKLDLSPLSPLTLTSPQCLVCNVFPLWYKHYWIILWGLIKYLLNWNKSFREIFCYTDYGWNTSLLFGFIHFSLSMQQFIRNILPTL